MLRKFNKYIVYLLTVSMLAGTCSVTAMAADETNAGIASTETVSAEDEDKEAEGSDHCSSEEEQDQTAVEEEPAEELNEEEPETADDHKGEDAEQAEDQKEDQEADESVEDSTGQTIDENADEMGDENETDIPASEESDITEKIDEEEIQEQDSSEQYERSDEQGSQQAYSNAGRYNISDAEIILDQYEFIYNAKAQHPEVTIIFGGIVLEEGVDYDVYGGNESEVGEHSILILGKGNYTGAASVYYTIKKQEQIVTGTSIYNKTIDDTAFYLDAETEGYGSLRYESSNTDVVEVNSSGKVTIKGGGTAVISIYAEESIFCAESAVFQVTINIKKRVQEIAGTTSYTKRIGDTWILQLTKKGDGALVYQSSNSNIAAVDSSGKVSIKGTGSAVISVYANETAKYQKSNVLKINLNALKKQQIVSVTSSYRKVVGGGAFKLKAATNGNGSLMFASKNKNVAVVDSAGKVSIKKVGIAKITVYATETATCAKSAMKTIVIRVVPTKMALSSVAYKTKGKATVKWKKKTGISGYEIQYSVKSNFSRAKTVAAGRSKVSVVLSGLINEKTYYVRIRSYKTVDGEKLFSDWSAAKKVKIKSGTVKAYKKKPAIKVNSNGEFKNIVSWKKLAKATGYEVYAKKGAKGKWSKIGTTQSTKFEHKVKHGVWYSYKVRAYQQLAEGTVLYGPYSAEKEMLQYYTPDFDVLITGDADNNKGVIVFTLQNKGNATMRVYTKGAYLKDYDYTNFNRNLHLNKTKWDYIDFSEISYKDIKPRTTDVVAFNIDGNNTWYDRKSKIFFQFRYDGVMYWASVSSYFGTRFYKQ